MRRLTEAGRLGHIDAQIDRSHDDSSRLLGGEAVAGVEPDVSPLSIGFSTMETASLVLLGPAHPLGEGGVLGEHFGELVGMPW